MNSAYQTGYLIGYYGVALVIAFCVVQFILKPKYYNNNQKEMSGGAYFVRLLLIFVIGVCLLGLAK